MLKISIMLEDFRLKVFMTVAESGSFTKAAEALHISQPAVSQNIAELEKVVGRRLFDRLPGDVVLTSYGHVFREYAERIVKAYESLSSVFSHADPCLVRLCAAGDLTENIISPLMDTFFTIHPEITFEAAEEGNADLKISLVPASPNPFDVPADSISRIRLSATGTPKMGGHQPAHEKLFHFDLLYQPSPQFAGTELCRVLKEHITASL